MKHPLATTAALRRALTPGTTVRIVNHFRPQASRLTVVLPKTNTVSLVTHSDEAPHGAYLAWPKTARLRPVEDDHRQVHVDQEDGSPFLTITVLESEHLDALDAAR